MPSEKEVRRVEWGRNLLGEQGRRNETRSLVEEGGSDMRLRRWEDDDTVDEEEEEEEEEGEDDDGSGRRCCFKARPLCLDGRVYLPGSRWPTCLVRGSAWRRVVVDAGLPGTRRGLRCKDTPNARMDIYLLSRLSSEVEQSRKTLFFMRGNPIGGWGLMSAGFCYE
ncbi:uncharacterized protein LY89DRAFT_688045 [Mollisia scopiformis]|uniref:Uncharacterized protein n=1 Tax=Mollisia scopiformis TaxID=149040 RepID=A0A194WWE5_MOLSC|nr:uncharacterized protein LY89DRAFT_688045 [Mollisia scopiformis]KUJ12298.1 hypothetical protein LY89DRAFT_688045 [Mollisia scopiformis]